MVDCLEDIVSALLSTQSIRDDSDLLDLLTFYTQIKDMSLANPIDLERIFECIAKVSKYAITYHRATQTVVEHDFRKILKKLIDEILFNIDLAASDKLKIFLICQKEVNSEQQMILSTFSSIAGNLIVLEAIILECNLGNIERNKVDILLQFRTVDQHYGSKCIDYSERACVYTKAIVEKHITNPELCKELKEFLESYSLARKLPSVIKIIEVIDTLLPNYFNFKWINPKDVKIVIREPEEDEEKIAVDNEEVKIENSNPTIEQGGEKQIKIRAVQFESILSGEKDSNSEELKYEEGNIHGNESDASTKDTINLKVELENKNNECFVTNLC